MRTTRLLGIGVGLGFGLVVGLGLWVVGCSKSSAPAGHAPGSAPAGHAPGSAPAGHAPGSASAGHAPGSASARQVAAADPEFDKHWADLAKAGIEVAYIEDDRGEGLMGNVRRASRVKAEPPVAPPTAAATPDQQLLPEQPSGDEVQRIIRGNLMSVRGCYMTMARQGQARSGKAIVSFVIGADGKPAAVRVESPGFRDTPLPRCVTAQIERWSFPKSQKGGGAVSYPFVFVGG